MKYGKFLSCNLYLGLWVYLSPQYLASLGIQSLVQQRAFAGKTANKLMDALKDSDLLHWKHSLSELIDISIAQKTAIWRLYGRRWVFRRKVKAVGIKMLYSFKTFCTLHRPCRVFSQAHSY